MVFALIGRAVWGLGKFGVKHIVVPIAISMVTAAVLKRLTERVEARHPIGGPEPDGAPTAAA